MGESDAAGLVKTRLSLPGVLWLANCVHFRCVLSARFGGITAAFNCSPSRVVRAAFCKRYLFSTENGSFMGGFCGEKATNLTNSLVAYSNGVLKRRTLPQGSVPIHTHTRGAFMGSLPVQKKTTTTPRRCQGDSFISCCFPRQPTH